MMKIILISSEEKNYALVKSLISEFTFLYASEIEFDYHKNLCAALKDEILKTDSKKIYLISIKNANKNKKFSLVKFIRDNDYHSEIIFLKDPEMLFDKNWTNLYKIFSVIETTNKLKSELKKCLKLILDHFLESKTLNFKNRDMDLTIYFEKILYIYRDTKSRKVIVVTDNNSYSLNANLKDICYLLDDRFKQVHRACIVNIMRTEKFDWSNNSIILDNGKIIKNMLSKHYKGNLPNLF